MGPEDALSAVVDGDDDVVVVDNDVVDDDTPDEVGHRNSTMKRRWAAAEHGAAVATDADAVDVVEDVVVHSFDMIVC